MDEVKKPLEDLEQEELTSNEELQQELPTDETELECEISLEEELENALSERDEYLNLAQKVQAEFDNYRRRTKNTRAEAFDDGAGAFIKTILPVCDDLERAIQSSNDEGDAVLEGVKLVYRKLMDALEKRGVEVIDRQGEVFDPRLEDAVAQDDASMGEPGTVSAVLLKGYKMGDYVLRHAMVKVVAEQ